MTARHRAAAPSTVVEVDRFGVELPAASGTARPVRGVSLNLREGEVLAVVGESGAGKSMLAGALLGLLPRGARVHGSVRFRGRDVFSMPAAERRALRGNRIAMVFQEPLTSLNPLLTVGFQLTEAIRAHRAISRRAAAEDAATALEQVGIGQAHRRLSSYPHEFSGGMRQRIMIAMAIVNEPDVLVADEPTTALDVTVQSQVLETLRQVRDARGLALVLVTHDLGVVAAMADRVAVMYAGRVVEEAPVDRLFHGTRMPYTAGLIRSMPALATRGEPLRPIPGVPASASEAGTGCPFAPRCPAKVARCERAEPELLAVDGEGAHRVACLRARELGTEALMNLYVPGRAAG